MKIKLLLKFIDLNDRPRNNKIKITYICFKLVNLTTIKIYREQI